MVASSQIKPVLWLLAGINGAGKTSLFYQEIKRYADRYQAPFINADEIQAKNWPGEVGKHDLEAAKIADQQRREHLSLGKPFVAETVFSRPSWVDFIKDAQKAGFEVRLFHVNLKNADLAVKRVATRVTKGGHHVPEDKIRKRYDRLKANIVEAAKIADYTKVFDNSKVADRALGEKTHKEVLAMQKGRIVRIADAIPRWAREMFAEPLSVISEVRQNAAAHSFKEAEGMGKKQIGADTVVIIPQDNATYKGKILGQTALHTLQQVGKKKVVAHFSNGFKYPPKIGVSLQIRYDAGKIKRIKSLELDLSKDQGR